MARSIGEYKEVVLYAKAKPGYRFLYWESQYGRRISDTPEYRFLEPLEEGESLVYIACFEKKAKVVVTSNIEEAGTQTGAGYYDDNYPVILRAKTNEGYRFVGWATEDGCIVSYEPEYFLVARRDETEEITYIAQFEKEQICEEE